MIVTNKLFQIRLVTNLKVNGPENLILANLMKK